MYIEIQKHIENNTGYFTLLIKNNDKEEVFKYVSEKYKSKNTRRKLLFSTLTEIVNYYLSNNMSETIYILNPDTELTKIFSTASRKEVPGYNTVMLNFRRLVQNNNIVFNIVE